VSAVFIHWLEFELHPLGSPSTCYRRIPEMALAPKTFHFTRSARPSNGNRHGDRFCAGFGSTLVEIRSAESGEAVVRRQVSKASLNPHRYKTTIWAYTLFLRKSRRILFCNANRRHF
jgi:hypothetical protein